MAQDASIRRILLMTALVLLVLTDMAAIVGVVESIAIGNEFKRLGVPDMAGGLAEAQIPAILVLLWVTFRVLQALRSYW